MFGVTSLAPCALLFTKAGTLICKISAERFNFSNSDSLTRKLICFGSFRFGFPSAKVASKISRSLTVPPPCFSSLTVRNKHNTETLSVSSFMLEFGGLQALCLLATSWRKRPCWGNAAHPQTPLKTCQNVAVLSQKKRPEMCPFRSLFLARSSHLFAVFFRYLIRKKLGSF